MASGWQTCTVADGIRGCCCLSAGGDVQTAPAGYDPARICGWSQANKPLGLQCNLVPCSLGLFSTQAGTSQRLIALLIRHAMSHRRNRWRIESATYSSCDAWAHEYLHWTEAEWRPMCLAEGITPIASGSATQCHADQGLNFSAWADIWSWYCFWKEHLFICMFFFP